MNYSLASKPIFTAACAVFENKPGLAEYFMVYPKFDEPYSMARKVGNTLEVPRNCVPLGEDRRVSFPPLPAINCKKPPLSAEQAKALQTSVDLLLADRNHIIEAPTGWGKTYAGTWIANQLGQPTLIIVTKDDLMAQWYSTLVDLIGINPKEIGKIKGSVLKYKGCRFTIAMLHSLVKDGKYSQEVYNSFGTVIFDETHRLAATTFEEACRLLPAKYRLGLTATPNRSDGKWTVIEAHLGPILVKGETIPMSPRVLVKKTDWELPSYPQVDPDTGYKVMRKMPAQAGRLGAVVKRMGADKKRNAIIVSFVVEAYKAGRTVVVMSEQISAHLEKLEPMLIKAGIPPIDIGYYISKDKSPHKRVVLATFAMCAEGTNIIAWDSLVLASPRADVKQSIGRIMRFVDGKKTPVVLDLVDKDAIFKGFFYSRLKGYFSVKSEVIYL